MNKDELKKLMEVVKKRYEEEKLDIKNCKIDDTYTYEENLDKIEEQIKEEKMKIAWEDKLKKILETNSSETLEKLYYVPNNYIEMVVKGHRNGLFLYGDGGWGKSFNVKKHLINQKLIEGEDYVFICGHITPAQFYIKLYHARDKIVVFDDVNILESKTNLNMLKACLNENSHNKIEYHTTSKVMEKAKIPSSFLFNGQVIILLNEKPIRNQNLNAVETRILHHHLDFGYQDKISILYDIAKLDYDGVTIEERVMIANWIKESTNEATQNLNIRLLFICFDFYKHNQERWKELASNYIQNDEYTTLLIQGTEKDWCEATGKNRATFYREKKKLGISKSRKVAELSIISTNLKGENAKSRKVAELNISTNKGN